MKDFRQYLKQPLLVSIFVFVILMITVMVILSQTIETNEKEQYFYFHEYANRKAAKISYELNTRINKNQALAAFIKHHPNLTQDEFEAFVISLLEHDDDVISAMSYKKDFVIHFISPYEANKDAIGFDLKDTSLEIDRISTIIRCIENNKACLEGPLALAIGIGIVSYAPIIKIDKTTGKRNVLGVADVIILWDRFLEVTELDQESNMIDIALREKDGPIFLGDSAIFYKKNAMHIPIKSPVGDWVFTAYPKDSWTSNTVYFSTVNIALVLAAFGIPIFIYLIMVYSLSKINKSEQRYRLISEAMSDMVWVIDLQTEKFVFVAGTYSNVLGKKTYTEIKELTLEEIVPPEAYKNFMNFVNRSIELATDVLHTVPGTIEWQGYNGIWYENTFQVIKNDSKHFNQVIGTTRIIDDRKKIEKALKDSEKRYRTTVENVRDMIWTIDLQTGKYVFLSGGGYSASGYTNEESLNLTLEDTVSDEYREQVPQIIAQVIEDYNTGKIKEPRKTMELQLKHKNGSLFWVETSFLLVKNNSDEFNQMTGVSRVIEDRKKVENALKESEERYRLTVENMSDLIWTFDIKTERYTFVAGAVYEVFGYTAEEFLGISLADTTPPESVNIVREAIATVIEDYNAGKIKEPITTVEIQEQHKDGSLIWIESSFRLIKNNSDEFNQITGITRVIEDRKKAETALKDSEAKYRMIADNTNDFIWVLNYSDLEMLYCGEACERSTGWTSEEYMHFKTTEMLLPESHQKAVDTFNAALNIMRQENKTNINGIILEAQQYNKNGTTNWIEISAKIILDNETDKVKIIGVSRNIDARKKIELALKDSESRYSLIANTIKDIIVILEYPSLQYVYVAGACEELTGYTPEELLTKTLKDIVPPESFEAATNLLARIMEDYYAGTVDVPHATFETQQYHKNGSIIWIEASAQMTLSAEGLPMEIIAVTRVIEDRKKIELKLKENEQRYRLLADNMNDMFWTMDIVTKKFTFMSGTCYKISGFTAEEYLNMALEDILPPHYFQIASETIERRLIEFLANSATNQNSTKSDVGVVLELQQYHKNGSLLWIEVSAKFLPPRDAHSNIEIVATTRLIEVRKKFEIKLKESERKYNLFAENTNDWIWMFDLKINKFIYVSGAYQSISGYSYEKLLSVNFHEIMPLEASELVSKEIEAMKAKYSSGQKDVTGHIEIQQYHKDGYLIWTELSLKLVTRNDYDDNNNYDYDDHNYVLVGSTRLIQERKLLYAKLKSDEEKYRAITENAKDPIWTMDLKTLRYTFMSPSCYELYGWTPEEYLNLTAKDTLSPESFEYISNIITEGVAKYNADKTYVLSTTTELQKYHKNGSLIWVEISAKILPGMDGELSYIVAVVRNIEERKRSSDAMEKSERHYRLITENMRDVVWTMDVNTMRYLYISESIYELAGFTVAESLGQSLNEIFPPESVKSVQQLIETEFARYYAGELSSLPNAIFDIQMYHKNGHLIWVEISAKAMAPNESDESGILTTLVGTTRLIDDRKAAEKQIVEQHLELEHQKEDLMKQKEELEKTNAQKNKFFSIIAHDLRNPFTALYNTVDFLKIRYSELPSDKVIKYIDTVHRTTEQIYGLLEALLEWARSSMDRVQFIPIDTNIYELVNSVASQIEMQASAKKIHIDVKNKTLNLMANCDEQMIRTVLRNLVSNAIKFSHMDSTITVTIDDYKNYFIISVKDTGVGISADQCYKLFRIDEKTISTKGTKDEAGTGLGLILCKEFIDKHRGKIWVESVVGEGSTFYFTVPKYISVEYKY